MNAAWCCAALLAFSTFATADEKKVPEEKMPQPPRVNVVIPLAVASGTTNLIKIRGQNLTNVTELRFTNANLAATMAIKAKTRAEVPKEADAKIIGDTQLEVELVLPAAAADSATNYFVAVSPDGESEPKPLLILSRDSLRAEKEPNGGFKQAQLLPLGGAVTGTIHEAGDVDVFRFTGKAGQKVQASVTAASSGSALDAVLTLHSSAGHILATSDDDDGGKDSRLRATLPADGTYCLTLQDAHDKGGSTHVYLLTIRVE